jgi:glutaredoxin
MAGAGDPRDGPTAAASAPGATTARREPLWRTLLPLVLVVGSVGVATELWQSYRQAELGREAAAAAAGRELLMLSSTTCAICAQARLWLQTHRVPFRECFIDTDPACRERFEAVRAVGTPVFLLEGRVQVGFSPSSFVPWLERAGPAR